VKNSLGLRFWLELVLGTITAILFLVTLVWHDWIEILFDADPDKGNGLVEWGIVGILLVATIILYLLAGYEWRKARASVA
jgi:hypothetical protein